MKALQSSGELGTVHPVILRHIPDYMEHSKNKFLSGMTLIFHTLKNTAPIFLNPICYESQKHFLSFPRVPFLTM